MDKITSDREAMGKNSSNSTKLTAAQVFSVTVAKAVLVLFAAKTHR
jgi:hypothetical protein